MGEGYDSNKPTKYIQYLDANNLMFKDGICGGVATATHRFGRANNKYMGEGHKQQ